MIVVWVSFRNVKKMVTVQCDTLEEFKKVIAAHFGISSTFSLDVFDKDFMDFIPLDTVSELPAKARVNVTVKLPSPKHTSLARSTK